MRRRQPSTGAAGSGFVPLCATFGAALVVSSCLNPLTEDFPSRRAAVPQAIDPVPVVPDPSDPPDSNSGGGLIIDGEGAEQEPEHSGVGDAGAAEPDGGSPDAGDEGDP